MTGALPLSPTHGRDYHVKHGRDSPHSCEGILRANQSAGSQPLEEFGQLPNPNTPARLEAN